MTSKKKDQKKSKKPENQTTREEPEQTVTKNFVVEIRYAEARPKLVKKIILHLDNLEKVVREYNNNEPPFTTSNLTFWMQDAQALGLYAIRRNYPDWKVLDYFPTSRVKSIEVHFETEEPKSTWIAKPEVSLAE